MSQLSNYPNLPEVHVPRDCLQCGRSFLPNKCPLHCTNHCCQDWECENAVRSRRSPRTVHTRCIVCHAPPSEFKVFAPCTRNCAGSIFFQSTRSDPGTLGAGLFRRRFVSPCHLRDTWVEEWHKPDVKPRKHVDYCSLNCYNSVAFGHETRRLLGQRRRGRRAESRRGGQPAEPGWRNRWRQEQGYFRRYQAEKRRRQENLLRYGDDRSEAELRSMEALREAAANDPAWQEAFGPGSGA